MSAAASVRATGCILFCAAAWAGLAAQTPVGSALLTVTELRCEFRLLIVGNWADQVPTQETKPARLSLRFTSIRAQEGSADAEGGFGSPHVTTLLAGRHLHFFQTTHIGTLYATTVFDEPDASGRLRAVHSRHEFTDVSVPGFTSKPEQYYGQCEIVRTH